MVEPRGLFLDCLVLFKGIRQFELFRFSEALIVLFDQELVSPSLRFGKDYLVFQVDLQRRRSGILADEQVQEYGAGQEFFPSPLPVNTRVLQGTVVGGHLCQCATDDFYQRRIDQREYRGNARNLFQVFP